MSVDLFAECAAYRLAESNGDTKAYCPKRQFDPKHRIGQNSIHPEFRS